MFGTKQPFTYAECPGCECLQLTSVPPDLAAFYPNHYYSYRDVAGDAFGLSPDRLRAAIAFYFAGYGLRSDSRILDVGSGSGSLLNALARAGYSNSLGIDPYITDDIRLSSGPVIRRADISQVDAEWDVILFNHSFEHLTDPAATLEIAWQLLAKGGVVVIRMPAVPCHAWSHYKEHWVQLDPPRHVFIHSGKSLAILARAAGLVHVETRYDSTGFQFWGSELYRRGVPLSKAKDVLSSVFGWQELAGFEARARELNAKREGDQAAFYLRRAS